MSAMIPAGYLYKSVVDAPDSVGAPARADVYSVSGCISSNFADYIPYWRHNGYWLFDSPEIIERLAAEHAIDLTGHTLFYYEVLEEQYDEDARAWRPLPGNLPFPVDVQRPAAKRLEGFDVVTFSVGTSPECSPLTCNGVAARVGVNSHSLLDTLESARAALESRIFEDSEPGPLRIFAVYTIP
jgi:hypothetical protein